MGARGGVPRMTVATHGHGEGTCSDCGKPLSFIRYRFGLLLVDYPCAVVRMRRGERCHA
jgi:hypothetical protein